MTTDRIKEIQEKTAYPESVSVKQALLQVWNECELEKKQKGKEMSDMNNIRTTLFELLKNNSTGYVENSERGICVDDLNVDEFLDEALNIGGVNISLPSVDDAGIIAVEIADINNEMTAQEQAFFIAGFSECIKYLEMQSNER